MIKFRKETDMKINELFENAENADVPKWFKTGAQVQMNIPGYQGPGKNGEKMTLTVTSPGHGYVSLADGSKRGAGVTPKDIKPYEKPIKP